MTLTRNEIVQVVRRRSETSTADAEGPVSPPILADYKLQPLREQVDANKKAGTNYKYFVLGSIKKKNIVQVAASSDSVMKDLVKNKKDLERFGGLAFVINALPTRGFFDFDCEVFEDETVEEKAPRLKTWILERFLTCLYKHLKVPKSHHNREIISTKHRKNKASFHVIIPVVTDDPRAWSYLMKEFWSSHPKLLNESWAFLRTTKKNCKNSQANGVEDGAPRGSPFGSAVHQWIEFGRVHPEGMTPWDAHPQRLQADDYRLETDKKKYGKRKRIECLDHAVRATKKARYAESDSESRGIEVDQSSNDSVAAWDQYPLHSQGVKLAFQKVSEMTGSNVYDMDLLPCTGNSDKKSFIIKYKPTERSKHCPLVKGHVHKKNNAKFLLILEPLTLLAGCHSGNHPAGTPKWKEIFCHTMLPFEPPTTPTAIRQLSGSPEAVYLSVPTNMTFRVQIQIEAEKRTVDITNLTDPIDYYSIFQKQKKFLKLPTPSCIQFDEFINSPGALQLEQKCYLLK